MDVNSCRNPMRVSFDVVQNLLLIKTCNFQASYITYNNLSIGPQRCSNYWKRKNTQGRHSRQSHALFYVIGDVSCLLCPRVKFGRRLLKTEMVFEKNSLTLDQL